MLGASPPAAAADEGSRAGRLIVVALLVPVVAVIGYFALGMPGMDHGDPTATSASMAGMAHEVRAIDSDTFARRAASPGTLVINVHVPEEGRIDGTDLDIPYDRIVGDPRLPTDRSTPILLYCKTGRMSAVAAEALMRAGYTDVAHLEGGMDAWQADGRPLA